MARNASEETAEEVKIHPDLAAELLQLKAQTGENTDKVQRALAKRVRSLRDEATAAASARVHKRLERI